MGNIIAIREIGVLQGESLQSVNDKIGQVIFLFNSTLESARIKDSDNVAIVTPINPILSTKDIADNISKELFNDIRWSENKFIDDNINPTQLSIFLRRMFAHSTNTFVVIAGLHYIRKLASVVSIGNGNSPTYVEGKSEELMSPGSVHYLKYTDKKK